MSLDFPRTRSEFWEQLGFRTMTAFWLDQYLAIARSLDGTSHPEKYGEAIWRSRVTLKPRTSVDVERILGLILGLGGDGTFHAYNVAKPWPLHDPDGSEINGANVKIRALGDDNTSFALKNLIDYYALAIGDMGCATFGDNERYLFKMAGYVEADNNGDTTVFQVQPPLPDGLAVNDDVTLDRPYGIFRITPGSFTPPESDWQGIADGISFEIEEA